MSYNVHYYLGHKDTIKIHRYCRYTWHPGLANKTKQITLKFMDESYRDNALLWPYFPENGTDCEFKNVIWKYFFLLLNKVDIFVWLLQMSEVVGFDIKPEATTSLCNMLEYNLHKHTEK